MKKALVMLLTIALMLSALIVPAAQAEKPETLKILRFYSYIDLAADNALGLTEEATGYNLEFDTLPIENWIDQLNLMFASGDFDYDYIRFGATEESKNMFNTLASKGLLADLTDLLPKYA